MGKGGGEVEGYWAGFATLARPGRHFSPLKTHTEKGGDFHRLSDPWALEAKECLPWGPNRVEMEGRKGTRGIMALEKRKPGSPVSGLGFKTAWNQCMEPHSSHL